MTAALHVLIIEDRPADAELMVLELQAGGFDPDWRQVDTEANYRACLDQSPLPDVILSDYHLPDFDGLRALRLLQQRGLDIPFILVSGTIGEEVAVEALKQGAADYLLKDRMARLGPAVAHALQERELREQKRRAEEVLRQSENRFRALIENSTDGIVLLDPDGTVLYTSRATARILGGTADEWLGGNVFNRVHPDDLPHLFELFSRLVQTPGEVLAAQCRYRHKDEAWHWLDVIGQNLLAEPSVGAIVVNYRDITGRRQAEAALRASEERYRTLAEAAHDTIFVLDRDERFQYFNSFAAQQFGKRPDELIGQPIAALFPLEVYEPRKRSLQAVFETGEPVYNEVRTPLPGRDQWSGTWLAPIKNAAGEVQAVLGIARDITERVQRERELEAIAAVSAALRTARTRAEMLPVILDQLLRLLDAGGAALAMRDPNSGETIVELARGTWAAWAGIRLPPGEGISGHVMATGRPYVNDDVRADRRMTHLHLLGDLPAIACVPLIARDQTIGVLWIGRQSAIAAEEARLLTAVADIAASAIHRTTLHEQTEQRLQRLAALRAIDMTISSSLDLHLTFQVLLEQVCAQLNVDAAAILLLNPRLQTLEFTAGRGFRHKAVAQMRFRLGESNAGRVALERRIVSIPDMSEALDTFTYAQTLRVESFVAYYGVPLVAKGQVVGVLEIFHRAPLAPNSEWLGFLEALAGQAAIAIDNAQLFDNLQRSNVDLALAYDATIEGWSRALDLRDKETEGHTQRVTELTLRLAREMGIDDAELAHIRRGALLHDIGKMGVPDSILLKPGPLSDEEWVIMKKHPAFALDMLSPIAYLQRALDIPYYHHERWNGAGYPRGLKGEGIPLAARIFAVVDVWDALRSDRPYRAAWPEDRVREYLSEQAGKHFDPQVVEVFMRVVVGS